MKIRRLPKPNKHWSDPTFSQEEVDNYERSVINVAIQEAGTPYYNDVIVYLMENYHPDGPHKRAGSKKVWNINLQILIACMFELEKAKTLELRAERILKKYPLLNQLIKKDPKTKDGIPGLIRQRNTGISSPLYPSESEVLLNNPDLIPQALINELRRLKIPTE